MVQDFYEFCTFFYNFSHFSSKIFAFPAKMYYLCTRFRKLTNRKCKNKSENKSKNKSKEKHM